MKTTTPSEHLVQKIVMDLTLGSVISISRFSTGLSHYVYDVKTSTENLVIRLTKLDQKSSFESAVYWYQILKPLGIPLPTFRSSDLSGKKYGFPFIIMDRLPGTDLLHAYKKLTKQQKEDLAKDIFKIQQKVSSLKKGQGFGYAISYEDTNLYPSWQGVLDQYMERIRTRNNKTKLINPKYIQRLAEIYKSMAVYIQQIKPTPFLDDITTKNVIIDQGKLSGVVDIDNVCFGDPLLTLALTQMSLISSKNDTYYTDYWANLLSLTKEQKKALAMYIAMFALDFASEMGQKFNKDLAEKVNYKKIVYLTSIFETIAKDF